MKKIDTRILVVDDQDEVLIASKLILKRTFEYVYTLNDPKKILAFLAECSIDIILLDMNFRVGYEDGKEGIYRFKEIKEHFPAIKLILMTSYGNVETAVEGIKLGAIDYILKPWDNEKLIETIKQTVKQIRKTKSNPTVSETKYFIGDSIAIKEVYKLGERLAKTDATVLILGENGTGKFVLADYIHKNSARKDKPFVHVDLGALHENLFESELFGYSKGAFTDAFQDKAGRFETANEGTIFLDEIGNIPLHLQSKLLQVIQNKSVTRLGESKPRSLNVRIITATNVDLQKAVDEKLFREDLFYRINTMSLSLPSLKNRLEDLEAMTNFFIDQFSEKYQVQINPVALQLIEKLKRYSWRGNIRELQNRVERAVILAEREELTLENLGFSDENFSSFQKSDTTLSEVERQFIVQALKKNHGNISRCAEELGVSRPALYRKLEKYHIEIQKDE
ncbi:sigma-54-dependent transcriptional regulator [Sphingobacterium hungaricum]|uniref:Sigma-54-dependent Fis family transcriptional regulator n=1 Tax=Sphingobacterium hungaricum TaxID=2082723 RepID=A0A928YRI7_9SPHI|nr:sigma-54 dependent transcriptional regulator [Sphingobacterium hungaricum]MBE8715034.1 sigma-54-dependent Fis family transcriptional regulator [Sphingobacterium hungaricum]